MSIQPVILSGGSGTRLWPLSRKAFPKQFLKLIGDLSLFQRTCMQLDDSVYRAPVVICNEQHRFIVAEQMREIGIKPAAIILEPVGRNTAAAALIAALLVEKQAPDDLVLLLPSDHLIADRQIFTQTVETGVSAAARGNVVTFGVAPTSPHTGYGYIETGKQQGGVREVRRFVEKPDPATAQSYLDQGHFLWNAGIFLYAPQSTIAQFEQHAPQLIEPCGAALDKALGDLDFLRLDADSFETCDSLSFDVAIMEKSSAISCVPLQTDWTDLGSYTSLWEAMEKDADGNAAEGDVLMLDSNDCLAHSKDGISLSMIGLEHVVAVVTKDAVLVTSKARAQDVKTVTEKLKQTNHEMLTFHSRVYRPWGWYEGLNAGHRYQVKCLMVKPGEQLSLQSHHHRAEHWVVVSGTAEVSINGEVRLLSENQSTYIPIGATHRLANPGRIPALLIEVQSGSYLGEDDIVRLDDVYGRLSEK